MNAITTIQHARAVPAEFRGLARQFLNQAYEEHTMIYPALDHLIQPVYDRLCRHPDRHLRDGTLSGLALQWERLPHRFRLAWRDRIDKRGRGGDIIDVRVFPARLLNHDWGGGHEESLVIHSHDLRIPMRDNLLTDTQSLASVSLHALARHYQRCCDRSEKALVADLLCLVSANVNDVTKSPTDKEFRIATPHGAWLGKTMRVGLPDDEVCVQFVVRTFVDHDLG